MPERIVSSSVYNPQRPSIFKSKANDRAESRRIYCSAEQCPLLEQGCCTMAGMFSDKCPYGRNSFESGPTKRAKRCSQWCKDHEVDGVGVLKAPPKKLAFIGDWVYLPYAHMDMCEKVPFKSHSAFIISGSPFLPREHWTIETVLTLIDFRPQAMMGGEIRTYQREQVPLFVQHLRECDAEMFAELRTVRPEFDVAPDYVGRTAKLHTLNSPIRWSTDRDKYAVVWEWDGNVVKTSSPHAYNSTWGKLAMDELELTAVPEPDATITVKSNDWVNGSTEFVD